MRAFQLWCAQWATECLRALKPGGHLLAFGGTRTWHRLACAVEDAGFEVRDSIAWMYGSGFPKSLDVSKAIDKAAGATPIDLGESPNWRESKRDREAGGRMEVRGANAGRITAPATPDAATWAGWGTALKPAFEPVVVARKPLAGTVAQTVLAHGTGALNIDGCRIGTGGGGTTCTTRDAEGRCTGHGNAGRSTSGETFHGPDTEGGRWPANVVLDEHAAAALDAQSGQLASGANPTRRGSDKFRDAYGDFAGQEQCDPARGADTGGASRFYYTAKADATERPNVAGMRHPTVKPLDLMRWLVRLVTPPGGVVLEPFAGSGTTVEACLLEGFRCIAVEREADYLPLIVARITRQRDPVAHHQLTATQDDAPTLFDLLDGDAS